MSPPNSTPGPRFVLIPDNSPGDERRAINVAQVTYLTEFTDQTSGKEILHVHFHSPADDPDFLEFECSLEDALERLDPSATHIRELHHELDTLTQRIDRQEPYLFEATRRWRLAHPGDEDTIPDLGLLLEWLLAEIDKQDHV